MLIRCQPFVNGICKAVTDGFKSRFEGQSMSDAFGGYTAQLAAIHAGGPQISGAAAVVFVVFVGVSMLAVIVMLIKQIKRDRSDK
jgi:hypothetical protein